MPAQQGRLTVTVGSLAFFGAMSATLSVVLLEQLGILWLVPAARGRELWLMLGGLLAGAFLGITRANRLLHAGAGLVLLLWVLVSTTPVAAWLTGSLRVAAAPVPLTPSSCWPPTSNRTAICRPSRRPGSCAAWKSSMASSRRCWS